MLSSLQHAWDQHFKASDLVIVLCGSHVRTMETLLTRQSPLFGRLTGQWHLQPLPFAALRDFLPGWSAEERVAAYAVAGGVPAYLEWLDPNRSLSDNIRGVILSPGSMFIVDDALHQAHGESDWETVAGVYGDDQVPARWTFRTPADWGATNPGPFEGVEIEMGHSHLSPSIFHPVLDVGLELL